MSVVALSGGIGGAKLALGLSRVLEPGSLTVVANTGDDFAHLGLAISPDVDTLVYTLSGLADPERGWGLKDETWRFMDALAVLGGETWFRLGDADLAMHVERTRRLSTGEPLSAITLAIARRLAIDSAILPMSDDPVRTLVHTRDGALEFQDYFVRRQCAPEVAGVEYLGAGTARAAPGVLEALNSPDLQAIVICPSNPLLSVEPMLAVPGIRQALLHRRAPVVAVSPLIGGQAVKGPTAKMMRELGLPTTAATVAGRYAGLVDVFVVDPVDAGTSLPGGMRLDVSNTLMRSLADRETLARTVLAAARTYSRSTAS